MNYNYAMGGVGLTALIGVVIAAIWSKKKVGWIAGIAIAGLGLILLIYFLVAQPEWYSHLNEKLPGYLRSPLPFWIFATGSGAFGGMAYLIHSWKHSGHHVASASQDFADLDSAWAQILNGLTGAGVDPGQQRWFLLFGPDSSQVEALIAAAGVRTRMVVPPSPGVSVRAYLTPDGVLLEASGCTAIGARAAGGDARLVRLCELIRNLNPEIPPLRGLTLVLPIDWLTSGKERAAVARADLQRVADTLLVRAPICVVFTKLESLPGAPEFLGRMDPKYLDARCGFSLPAGTAFQPQPLARGLSWLERWYSAWTLNVMVQDYSRHKENAAIFRLSDSIRTLRPIIEGILNDIFVSAQGTEPFSLRGVYLCAADEKMRAFAPGLLRGQRARLITDHELVTWSTRAREQDRVDRNLVMKLGLGTLVLGLLWWWDIFARLVHSGPRHVFVGMIILLAMILGWFVGLGRFTEFGQRLLLKKAKRQNSAG